MCELAMNQNPTPQWSPMVSGPEDDFASFLDFGDLNFPTFSDGSASGTPQPSGSSGDAGAMDMPMENTGATAAGMISHPGIEQTPLDNSMDGFQDHFPGLNSPVPFMTSQQDQQQQARLQMQQQSRYYGHNAVPPTPNSLEMHGNHSEYYNTADRQQQLMYEHYRRHQHEQVKGIISDGSRGQVG